MSNPLNQDKALALTKEVLGKYFPDAISAIASGSLLRGEGDEFSDIDLIVLYDELPNACRRSLIFEGLRFECFVYDPPGAKYFMRDDQKKRHRQLMHMFVTGTVIGEMTPLAGSLIDYAGKILAEGPLKLPAETLAWMKYIITDLLDDVEGRRSAPEMRACGIKLYDAIAELFFIVKNDWLPVGKWIPREMARLDAGFAKRFETAFDDLFQDAKTGLLLSLGRDILALAGGPVWDGYQADAPKEWRLDD